MEILTQLPNLNMLNGKSTKEDNNNNVDIDGKEIDAVSLHNEISNFNVIIFFKNKKKGFVFTNKRKAETFGERCAIGFF